MNARVTDTNKFLQNRNRLLLKIAEATVTSFMLEGVIITMEEALRMAKESAVKITARKR